MDVSAFFAPPEILGAKRALCIQPHADDNEIGMGGTIAALAARGCEIHYLTVTNGDLGAQAGPYDPEHLADTRRAEAEAAGRALGASVFHWFDEPDGSLEHIPALAGRIAELIRTVQPDVVFCPDPWAMYEAHQDHVVTGKAAAQAFLSASLAQYPRGTATAPWQPGAIGFYFTQNPNTVVDVTDTFETKFSAMALHQRTAPGSVPHLFHDAGPKTRRGARLCARRRAESAQPAPRPLLCGSARHLTAFQ